MIAHVADASSEAALATIAKRAHADLAFRMSDRVFVVKSLDDTDSPDAIRAGLQGTTEQLGYPSPATKVGSQHAGTHRSVPG